MVFVPLWRLLHIGHFVVVILIYVLSVERVRVPLLALCHKRHRPNNRADGTVVVVLSLMGTSRPLNIEAVWTVGRPCAKVACVLLFSPL